MIRLQVLGPPALTGPDGTPVTAVLTQPKRLALLSYLALAEPRGFHRRDTLLAIFWPELGEEEARRALRQALHFLRQHLGENAIENRGTDEVALSRAAVACDAWEFGEAVARGTPAIATALVRGDPLAGFREGTVSPEFDEWLDRQRAGFRRAASEARRQLGEPAHQPPANPMEEPAPAAPAWKGRRLRWGAAAAGAVVLLAFMTWRRETSSPATVMSGPVPRVAIAIFANRTQDTTLDQLGIIAAEWITRGLSRVGRLEVLEPNVLYTRGRTRDGAPVDPLQLLRLSRSTYVVAGSYYRQGAGPLQMAAQVLDSSGKIVRTIDSVDVAAEDPLRGVEVLQSRLTSAVQSIVDPRATMIDAPVQSPPRYEAFQEFVRGQEAFWGTRYGEALDRMRRAAALDTNFLMAQVFTTVVAATARRCDLVDSLTPGIEARRDRITEFEQTTLGMSVARCRRDWPSGVELQRRRLELQPLSPVVRWTAAATNAMANRPRAALELYQTMRPDRDLAWLAPPGRASYWSSRAVAHHQASEFEQERRVGERLAASGDDPLEAAFIQARSLAALGDTAGVRRVIEALPAAPQPPPPLAVILPDHSTDAFFGHPELVRAQVAAELAAHGQSGAAGRIVAEMAARLARSGSLTHLPPAERYAMGKALLAAGRFAEARPLFGSLADQNPESITLRGTVGAIAARLGDTTLVEQVRRSLGALRDVYPPGLPVYYLAAIAAAAGDTVGALDLIESLPYGMHPVEFNEFHVDPLLAPIRDTPRFRRFIAPRG
jgi:TolB-like protein